MRSWMHGLLVATVLSTLLMNLTPMRIAAQTHQIDFQKDVSYGTGQDVELSLNLARPKGLESRVPGLIFIHGGGWTGGNKDSFDKVIKNAEIGRAHV